MSDSSGLIAQVEEWMYYEDDLTLKIQEWAVERCDTFISRQPNSYEHPPLHMELFAEYCQQFERMITGFLQINDLNFQEFWEEVKREHDKANPTSSSSSGRKKKSAAQITSFSAVLLAATEFDAFCEMMFDVRSGRGVVFCPPLIPIDADDGAMDEELSELRYAEGKSSYDDTERYEGKYSGSEMGYKTSKDTMDMNDHSFK